MHIGRIGRQQYMGRLSCKWPINTWPDELITWIFLVNLAVLTSIKAALTARMNDLWLLKVTRPEPIGYLYLSVSTPKYKQTTEMNKGRRLRVRQCKNRPTKTISTIKLNMWPTNRPITIQTWPNWHVSDLRRRLRRRDRWRWWPALPSWAFRAKPRQKLSSEDPNAEKDNGWSWNPSKPTESPNKSNWIEY